MANHRPGLDSISTLHNSPNLRIMNERSIAEWMESSGKGRCDQKDVAKPPVAQPHPKGWPGEYLKVRSND